jgi:hypothetical protein
MGVRDAVDIVAGHVDGAVNDETCGIDAIVRGVEEHFAVEVDLDQAGCVDLLVEHSIGVDQEVVMRAGNAT